VGEGHKSGDGCKNRQPAAMIDPAHIPSWEKEQPQSRELSSPRQAALACRWSFFVPGAALLGEPYN